MGRGKIPVKKIENNTNRQVTFSKRKIGVLKKAHELSTLCDVDVALIMFSPSNRLSFYSGKNRIEDVISRYVNLPDHETIGNLKDKEFLINTLNKLKSEKDIATERPSHSTPTPRTVEDILKEISQLQQEIDKAEKQVRMFEPQPEKFTSFEELEQCERQLTKALRQVTTRINYLSRAQHKQPAKIGV